MEEQKMTATSDKKMEETVLILVTGRGEEFNS
jgi:hypothetical protein